MNILKKSCLILLSLSMLILCVLPAYADEPGIMPCYLATEYCSPDFQIHNGVAQFLVEYQGIPGEFTYIEVRVKLQKKQLFGLYWKTVDVGEPNDTLVFTSYDLSGMVFETYPLSSTGTYRAVYYIKVHNYEDALDIFEDTITDTY